MANSIPSWMIWAEIEWTVLCPLGPNTSQTSSAQLTTRSYCSDMHTVSRTSIIVRSFLSRWHSLQKPKYISCTKNRKAVLTCHAIDNFLSNFTIQMVLLSLEQLLRGVFCHICTPLGTSEEYKRTSAWWFYLLVTLLFTFVNICLIQFVLWP